MKKERITISINDYLIEGIGTNNNDILEIDDNDTKTTFDLKNLVLTRLNNEVKITIDFINKKVSYYVPKTSKEFFQKLNIFSLTNSHKQVMISYQIEENEFLLKINHETI